MRPTVAAIDSTFVPEKFRIVAMTRVPSATSTVPPASSVAPKRLPTKGAAP